MRAEPNTIAGAGIPGGRYHPGDRFVDALCRRLAAGSLTVRFADGATRHYRGGAPGPAGQLRIHRAGMARRVLLAGASGFADSVLAGECDSPDLAAFLELALANQDAWRHYLGGHPLTRMLHRLAHRLSRNTRRGARRNIAAHYDLGNDFYAAWLDETMTYSGAVFDGGAETLADAQRAKYRRMASTAGLSAGQDVLELGCGWGGFACFAAAEIGCNVTALTLSDAQYAYASARVQREGLADRVRILKRDYRDQRGRFDAIVSIEMFEAVGEPYWPLFFERLRRTLAEGGRAALQIITIADERWPDYRNGADFIQRYIFPGGMLPSPGALGREFARAGFSVESDVGAGRDYARTLVAWRQRFEAAWPRIAPMGFDERFRRMWHYYLCYCEAGFRAGHIDVRQIALTRA